MLDLPAPPEWAQIADNTRMPFGSFSGSPPAFVQYDGYQRSVIKQAHTAEHRSRRFSQPRAALAALSAGTGIPADAPIAPELTALVELRLEAAQHVVRLGYSGELEELDGHPPRATLGSLECCHALRLETGDLFQLAARALCELRSG